MEKGVDGGVWRDAQGDAVRGRREGVPDEAEQ